MELSKRLRHFVELILVVEFIITCGTISISAGIEYRIVVV